MIKFLSNHCSEYEFLYFFKLILGLKQYVHIHLEFYGFVYNDCEHGTSNSIWTIKCTDQEFGKSGKFEFSDYWNGILSNVYCWQNAPEMEWTIIREHYVLLCELLEMVDDNLSAIILLSCVNNLYFICNQLLNIFK